MIASVDRGILVRACGTCAQVDPRTELYRASPRDCTFLIETGRSRRHDESPFHQHKTGPLSSEQHRDAGRAEAGGGNEAVGTGVPTLKVKDFNFTSLSAPV